MTENDTLEFLADLRRSMLAHLARGYPLSVAAAGGRVTVTFIEPAPEAGAEEAEEETSEPAAQAQPDEGAGGGD